MFGNVKIGVKLGVSFAIGVCIMVILAVLLIQTMDRLNELADGADAHSKEAMALDEADSRLEHLGTLMGTAIINRRFDKVRKEIADIREEARQDIARARASADSPDEKRAVDLLQSNYMAYLDLLENKELPLIESSPSSVPDAVAAVDREGDRLSTEAMRQMDFLGGALTKRSEQKARDFDQQSRRSQTTAIAMTLGGAALSILLAVLTSLGIVRPLAKMRDFALALAHGDLEKKRTVQQKDEVGQTADAIGEVRETLKGILGEIAILVEDLRCGRFTRRGDPARFQGAFADLVGQINALSDLLVGFIDELPVAVMSIDRDCGILYMNKQGLKLAGSDQKGVQGSRCHALLNTGDCRSPRCASMRAIQSGRLESSETTARLGGTDRDFDYSSLPLTDGKGAAVGAVEVFVDQTVIKGAQRTMQQLAAEAERISLQVSSAAEELSAQVEQSSRGAETQSLRASEAATAMEEMNSTVLEVAKNAGTAAGTTDSTKSRAQEGSDIVSRMVDAIHEVQRDMTTLSGNMNQLGRQAEDIGRIMTVITDIADQTNLLALNAAIEAARAGDAGRGFAVVADEVRKLAEKTMGATKEVGEAINSIQEMTRKSVQAVASSSQAVDRSTELAGGSGDALGEIVGMADSAADQVRSIATAAEQQAAAAEEITRATSEINQISLETSQAMNQSAQAVSDLARLAQELKGLIQRMAV